MVGTRTGARQAGRPADECRPQEGAGGVGRLGAVLTALVARDVGQLDAHVLVAHAHGVVGAEQVVAGAAAQGGDCLEERVTAARVVPAPALPCSHPTHHHIGAKS